MELHEKDVALATYCGALSNEAGCFIEVTLTTGDTITIKPSTGDTTKLPKPVVPGTPVTPKVN